MLTTEDDSEPAHDVAFLPALVEDPRVDRPVDWWYAAAWNSRPSASPQQRIGHDNEKQRFDASSPSLPYRQSTPRGSEFALSCCSINSTRQPT